MTDETAIREKLQGEIGRVDWQDLRAHATRGALIFVTDDLELVDVAVAVATDQADRITEWVNTERLHKPTPEAVASYASGGWVFDSVVVSPYVLAQVVAAAA